MAEFSDVSRLDDFENGSIAMDDKDYDKAIESFQICMKKLSGQGLGLTSDLFPKCLQNISICYKEKDDMENALNFAKFEKLYYETVLLHDGLQGLVLKENEDETTTAEPSRDRGDGSSEASNQDSSEDGQLGGNETLKRAAEYEQLAKLCLKQECVSLALEYSGKATILYRHHFGDDNENTKKSFEFFTSVYAEAGKKQYSESMEKAEVEANLPVSSPSEVEETIMRHRRRMTEKSETTNAMSSSSEKKPLKRTRSILKKRTSSNNMDYLDSEHSPTEPHRRVTFADPLPQMVRLRDDGESGEILRLADGFIISL